MTKSAKPLRTAVSAAKGLTFAALILPLAAASASALANGIQMLPPVTEATKANTIATTNSVPAPCPPGGSPSVLTWDGTNPISCATGVTVTGGNVGIGTTGPVAPLDIQMAGSYPAVAMRADNNVDLMWFRNGLNYPVSGYAWDFSNRGALTNPVDTLRLYKNGGAGGDADVVQSWQQNGNVGIGTTSPTTGNLVVIGTGTVANPTILDVAAQNGLTSGGDAKITIGQHPGNGDLTLLVAGTDTRTDGLTGNDQYIFAAQRLNLFNKGNGTTYNDQIALGVGFFSDITFSTAAQSAAAVERMRVTQSGNVGIGTTSPLGNLDVEPTPAQSATNPPTPATICQNGTCTQGVNPLRIYMNAHNLSWWPTMISFDFLDSLGKNQEGVLQYTNDIVPDGNVGYCVANGLFGSGGCCAYNRNGSVAQTWQGAGKSISCPSSLALDGRELD
jgi:hypothetical protein